MKNIQDEVQKIHNQYGVTEMANYKIQLFCEQYAKEYHEQQVKNLSLSAVSVNEVAVCPRCKSNKIAESEEHHSFMDCCNCGLTWTN